MITEQELKVLDLISEAEVIQVCQDLIRFETVNPPGNEEVAADYVAGYLSRAGFETRLIPLGPGRSSAIGRLRGNGDLPAVVLNGHLDVVAVGSRPWLREPFAAEVAAGRVWGRGSSDMKGGIASMLVAARALANGKASLRGDVVFAATADEEASMHGAETIVSHGELGALHAIIISEPTLNLIGLAERGVLWPEITTHGKTAHGSMPELGLNAITMMGAFLTELEQLDIPYTPHPVLGQFTRSVNTIEGGMKTNVVPDHCTVTIDMRTVPGQDHAEIAAQLQDLLARLKQNMPNFAASLRILYDMPSVDTPVNSPAVQQFAAALAAITGTQSGPQTVRFATEAAVFVPALRVPTVICGPGDPALAHQPDEYVDIDKMVEAAKVYALATARMLA